MSEGRLFPRVENQPSNSEALLSLVEAEHGVSVVPACARHLRSNGVRFYRLQPDDVRVEPVAAWKTVNPSVVPRAFLELIDTNADHIRNKSEPLHPSIAARSAPTPKSGQYERAAKSIPVVKLLSSEARNIHLSFIKPEG